MAQSDAAPREHTRLLLMYNLTPRIPVPDSALRPLTGALEFGRFVAHVEAAGRLLPRVVFEQRVSGLECGAGTVPIRSAGVVLAVTPRRDPLLFVDVEIGDAAPDDIADLLFTTWQDRAAMRIGGALLADWLGERLDAPGALAFGRNVHQSVFPGRDLARRLLADHHAADAVGPDVVTIVLRGTLDGQAGAGLGIRRPHVLNNPGQTMVAHGRGVSLIVGWTPAVENAFGLAAIGILNAVAAVHRIRGQAFEALELDQATEVDTVQDVRDLIGELARRLGDMQLDLSFSIEAYADSILIPELLVESFHSSLRAVSALAEGLENTSRIVERVDAVLATRRADLETATQTYIEKRDKVVAAVFAVGSVLALPPALLLAFFGVNSDDVDPRHSVLDLHRYGVAYALAWLPFLALAAVGAIARRRISLSVSRSLDPDRPDGHGGSAPGKRSGR
ncbi:MAG TPA: hypothetical protein VFU73_05695 [Actinocrinis sp.]|nr:hypothetical protein [Actinocrinis sp.]